MLPTSTSRWPLTFPTSTTQRHRHCILSPTTIYNSRRHLSWQSTYSYCSKTHACLTFKGRGDFVLHCCIFCLKISFILWVLGSLLYSGAWIKMWKKSAGFCEDHVTCLLIDGGYLLSISDTFVYWLGIRATSNDILMSAWSEVINSTCRQLGIITLAVSFLIDHNIWSSFIWNVLKRSITAICTILTWNWNSLHL